MSVKEAMQKLQLEANNLCAHSGYHHSLVRYHQDIAADFDKQIDVVAKKIRNLEANTPKEQTNASNEEISTNGSLGSVEGTGNPSQDSHTAPSIASL